MSLMGEYNKKRTARTETVAVLMDQDAATERERLDQAVIDATNTARARLEGQKRLGKAQPDVENDPDVVAAHEALRAHLDKMAESVLWIRFEQVPNHRWRQLQVGFPQRKNNTMDANFGYNLEAVLQAVLENFSHVAESEDAPAEAWDKPTKDEVKAFMEGLPGGEFNTLWWTMHNLNERKASTEGLKKG